MEGFWFCSELRFRNSRHGWIAWSEPSRSDRTVVIRHARSQLALRTGGGSSAASCEAR